MNNWQTHKTYDRRGQKAYLAIKLATVKAAGLQLH
jgi:hypothetical protein